MDILAEIQPLDVSTGQRVTVRVSATNDRDVCGYDGHDWWPAITALPDINLSLFDGDFSDAVSTGIGSLGLRAETIVEACPEAATLKWTDAIVKVLGHSAGVAPELFTARVESFTEEDGNISLSIKLDEEPFATDVLQSEYAGTTGIEGTDNIKDRVKPWLFGRCLGVEPVFIDSIDNVYQVSAYGPIKAISAVFENGASFGAVKGDYADYDALVAADIKEGEWGTCLAQGLLRLGAPAAGVITADCDGDNSAGWVRTTGAILSRIAAALGISGSVNAASLSALDADVARNVGIYISEQTSFLDLARRLAAPCNAVAGIGMDGKLSISRVAFNEPIMTLDAQGRQMPPVLGAARQNTSPPYKRIVMGAARCWRVHSFGEVAFYDDLIDRGAYSASNTYREGHIVTSDDKSRWLYISETPSSGNAPPTWPTASNAYWQNLEPPATAEGVRYADGTPVEDLKPETPGANRTQDNIAAGFAGAGSGAYANSLGELNAEEGNKLGTIELGATVGDNGITNGTMRNNAENWLRVGDMAPATVSGVPVLSGGNGGQAKANNGAPIPAGPGPGYIHCLARYTGTLTTRLLRVGAVGRKADNTITINQTLSPMSGKVLSQNFAVVTFAVDLPEGTTDFFPTFITTTAGDAAGRVEFYGVRWSRSRVGADPTADELKARGIDNAATAGDTRIINASLEDGGRGWYWDGGVELVEPTSTERAHFRYAGSAGSGRVFANSASAGTAGALWFSGGEGDEFFTTFRFKTDGARQVLLWARPWRENYSAAAAPVAIFNAVQNTAGQWVPAVSAKIVVPAGYPRIQVYWQLVGSANGTETSVSDLRVSETEAGATLGATAGENLKDEAGQTLTDDNIKNEKLRVGAGTTGGVGRIDLINETTGGPQPINSVLLDAAGLKGLAYDDDVDLGGAKAVGVAPKAKVDPATHNSQLVLHADGTMVDNGGGSPVNLGVLDALQLPNGPAEGGADKTANAQLTFLTPPAQIIYRDYTGVPKTGQFPRTLKMQVKRGETLITTDSSVSYAITLSNVTATVSNAADNTKGDIAVTDGGAGEIRVTVTVSGQAYGPFTIPFTVQDDPPPTSSGGGGSDVKQRSDSTIADCPNAVLTQLTSTGSSETIFVIDLAAGETLKGTAPLTYNRVTQGTALAATKMQAKWQYRLQGNTTWLDFGALIDGSNAQSYQDSETFETIQQSGSITVTQNKTGLAAGAYEVRLVGQAITTGTPTSGLSTFSGTANVVAE